MIANYTSAADLFADWKADLLSGEPPPRFSISEDERLASIEIGPGIVTLIGGPPGAGKSAFTMQLVIDALRLTPDLKALVVNVEMPPAELMNRQLARLSGIPLTPVRQRCLTDEHGERLSIGMDALASVANRLAFLRSPFSFENIAHAADAFAARLIVLDYIQRIEPPGEHANKKASVDASMNMVRAFADHGAAVVVVAAVGRQKTTAGNNGYQNLNLASFRESSELEYGADDAYLLICAAEGADADAVLLSHVKSRYGETCEIPLRFTKAQQRFDPLDDAALPDGLATAVRDAWQQGESEQGSEGEGGNP